MIFRLSSTSSVLSRATQCLVSSTVRRVFSTTPAPQTKTIKGHLLPRQLIPEYPYGRNHVYKQSNYGLYGEARIRSGRIVSPRGKHSPRVWRPNVHAKYFYLPSLGGVRVKTRVTLRVLRTIRRAGGLENYLVSFKDRRIRDLGPSGWNLRWLLLQSEPVQRRFNDERVALGLAPKPIMDNSAIIGYALDAATPGPLSTTSRQTLDEIRRKFPLGADFVIDSRDFSVIKNVKELSDEDEAVLLREMDDLDDAEHKVPKQLDTKAREGKRMHNTPLINKRMRRLAITEEKEE